MATLRKRPGSPYWQLRLQRNGREFWRSTHETHRARAEARAKVLEQEILDVAYGRALPAKDVWLLDWWHQYWRTHPGSTAASAAGKHAHVERLLGPWRLQQLRPSHFAGYIAARRATGTAPSTIALEGRLLKQVLKAAVEEGLLTTNPATHSSIPWPQPTGRSRVLTDAEEDALRAACPPWLERLVIVALGTGLRGAELLALEPSAIHWEVPCLSVVGKGRKRREVPVFPQALAALRVQTAGTVGRLWPISATPTQAVTTINHALARAWKRAGLEGKACTTHLFRHTFATRYVLAGGDIFDLSRVLGHASVTITEQVYAHLRARDITTRALAVQMP